MDVGDKILIYQTEDGQTQVDVRMENDTVWLTQAQMAELFQKDRTVIGRHIRNVYKEGELEENGTCAKFAHMGNDGLQRYETVLYNLDVIISVGYRVRVGGTCSFPHRGSCFPCHAAACLPRLVILHHKKQNFV